MLVGFVRWNWKCYCEQSRRFAVSHINKRCMPFWWVRQYWLNFKSFILILGNCWASRGHTLIRDLYQDLTGIKRIRSNFFKELCINQLCWLGYIFYSVLIDSVDDLSVHCNRKDNSNRVEKEPVLLRAAIEIHPAPVRLVSQMSNCWDSDQPVRR